MDTIVDRLEKIKLKISSLKPDKLINVIAVSKTFSLDHINPLIEHGHRHFGENKVQEAVAKWGKIKEMYRAKIIYYAKGTSICVELSC